MRKCKRCKIPKEESEFGKRSNPRIKKDGTPVYYFQAYCKKCQYEATKASQSKTPESIERNKQYQKNYHKSYVRRSNKKVQTNQATGDKLAAKE